MVFLINPIRPQTLYHHWWVTDHGNARHFYLQKRLAYHRMIPMFASVYIWHDWYNSNINITFVLRFVIIQCLTQMQIHTSLILTILCNVVSTSSTLDIIHYRHVILNTWYYNYIRDCIVKLNFKFSISQENVLFQQLYSIIIYHFTYCQHLTFTLGRM